MGAYRQESYANCDCCGGQTTGCCAGGVPGTLYATFGGSLAALGTVTLTGGPTVWSGTSAACGGGSVTFSCVNDVKYQITFGTSLSADNLSVVCSPFSWSASGTVFFPPCAGAATVTVTE